MRKLLSIGLLLIFICSCKQTKNVVFNNAIQPTEVDSANLYKVTSIETIKGSNKASLSVYKISIQRNDSSFIILSKSFSPKKYIPNKNKIQEGRSYDFNLTPIYTKEEIAERTSSPFFAINYMDYKHPIEFQGSYIHVDWECIVNSFTTDNLSGLYYCYTNP